MKHKNSQTRVRHAAPVLWLFLLGSGWPFEERGNLYERTTV
jgi:hypothetical protein